MVICPLMETSPEKGEHEDGLQTISLVVDGIDDCNLNCHYCHPLATGRWSGEILPATTASNVLEAADNTAILEVLLSGGEITLHPEFERILETTRTLGHTAVGIITNATRINDDKVRMIRDSNIDRICVSVDGPDAETHNSRRGRNFESVMDGLRALGETGKSITVISVLDRRTYTRILQLTELLADQGLANQHHLCAPSYSGAARRTYASYALQLPDYYTMQALVDEAYANLRTQGMHVTFNSFWPATGEHGDSEQPRTVTLGQLRERVKDIYGIVRPNGDVRSTAAAWGRETVGDAVVGNLREEAAATLLRRLDDSYRSGTIRQLPRIVEAGHKFQVGPYAGRLATNALLAVKSGPLESLDLPVQTEVVRPLSELDLLENPLPTEDLARLAHEAAVAPHHWRLVHHRTGVNLLFNRRTSHTTLLKPEETIVFNHLYNQYAV